MLHVIQKLVSIHVLIQNFERRKSYLGSFFKKSAQYFCIVSKEFEFPKQTLSGASPTQFDEVWRKKQITELMRYFERSNKVLNFETSVCLILS